MGPCYSRCITCQQIQASSGRQGLGRLKQGSTCTLPLSAGRKCGTILQVPKYRSAGGRQQQAQQQPLACKTAQHFPQA